MFKLMMGLLLAGASAGSMAQAAPAVDQVRIARPVLRIALPAERHNIWPDEVADIGGQYRLENGKKMELSMANNRMYVTIDGMPRKQLAAVTPYVFVAMDEKLRIVIDDNDPYGPRGAELMMVVPRMVSGTAIDELTRFFASR